jgi:TetR/AcrR family transcriptional regulator, transcriptional repressor of bet genes
MSVAEKTVDKRRVRGEESRKLILKAAVDSIATMGLGKLTLDRVADRVGISRGLVVFHFKSKDNLIEEVLSYLGRQYQGGWEAVLGGEAKSDMDRLVRLIDYDIRFACENPNYVSAWHAFWGEAKGNVMYQEQVVQRDIGNSRDMEHLLEKISGDGEYDKQELSLVTRGLFVMMFGIWVQLHLNPGPNDYELNTNTVRLFLGRVFPNTNIPD